MKDPILHVSQEAPHTIAVKTKHETYTYCQLHNIITATTKQLEALKTSIVSFRAQDPLHSIIILWACLRAKKIFFPLNPTFPDDYIQGFLQQAGISHTTEIAPLINLDQIETSQHNANTTLSLDQLASIIATSGSSGTPKLAVHSLNNHLASAAASQDNIPLLPGDTWLLNLPLFHVSGLSIVFRCFQAGATISLDTNAPYTHSSVVPTQLQRLLSETNTPFLSSKYCLVGGASLPKSLQSLLPNSPQVFQTYGLTEMSSQVITNNSQLTSVDLWVDPNTQELYVKGESLFQGYLSNGLIRLPLNKKGYFNTKDRIEFKDGTFYYLGRKDRMIISGGENIQPEEIENLLLQHPDVTRAAVIGHPDQEFGERPIAFVECENLSTIQSQINNYLEALPKFKRPTHLLNMPNIGKFQKIPYNNLRSYAQNVM